MVLMTATNLYSVRSYGEFEYWFAGVKVATIVIFIVLGTLFVFGLWPGKDMDFSNLTAHGGFFPNGVGALFSGIVVVIFSMVGAEIATIAVRGDGHRLSCRGHEFRRFDGSSVLP
jgi:GABA permease